MNYPCITCRRQPVSIHNQECMNCSNARNDATFLLSGDSSRQHRPSTYERGSSSQQQPSLSRQNTHRQPPLPSYPASNPTASHTTRPRNIENAPVVLSPQAAVAKERRAERRKKLNEKNATAAMNEIMGEPKPKKKNTICPYENCDRQFNYPSQLLRHVRALHEKQRPYKCPHCPSEFSKIHNVTDHIKRVHIVQKKYQCLQCSASFSIGGFLTKHTRAAH